jgi:hypothetical protein
MPRPLRRAIGLTRRGIKRILLMQMRPHDQEISTEGEAR